MFHGEVTINKFNSRLCNSSHFEWQKEIFLKQQGVLTALSKDLALWFEITYDVFKRALNCCFIR